MVVVVELAIAENSASTLLPYGRTSPTDDGMKTVRGNRNPVSQGNMVMLFETSQISLFSRLDRIYR